MASNYDSGLWGEKIAVRFLHKKGYRIIETRYRSRFGEVDIIARKGNILAFVEVKLRKSSSFAQALEFVDGRKQARLITTASCYLSEHSSLLQPRFDVIEIYAPEGIHTKDPVINHLEDAFE